MYVPIGHFQWLVLVIISDVLIVCATLSGGYAYQSGTLYLGLPYWYTYDSIL